jgi:hypothetical protein
MGSVSMPRRRHGAAPGGGGAPVRGRWARFVVLLCVPVALIWARGSGGGRVHPSGAPLRAPTATAPPPLPPPLPRPLRRPARWDPAVVLFCYARPNYLNQTLTSLARLPGLRNYSVYVSQDGTFPNVSAAIGGFNATFLAMARSFEHWQKPRPPGKRQGGPAWISQHYKWGLGRVFEERNHSHAIVLEEDMVFSPGGFWGGGAGGQRGAWARC